MNISCEPPAKDKCTACLARKKHVVEHVKAEKGDASFVGEAGEEAKARREAACDACRENAAHRAAKKAARADMTATAEKFATSKTVLVVSGDMMKALAIPLLDDKEAYFKRMAVVCNMTYTEVRVGGDSILVVWSEDQAGRMAPDMASANVAFLNRATSMGYSTVISYRDNSTSQNKCRELFGFLIFAVNNREIPGLEAFELRYLEKGHTYTSADTTHGTIAKHLKTCPPTYTFDELCTAMQASRTDEEKLILIKLGYKDFMKFGPTIFLPKIDLRAYDAKIIRFHRHRWTAEMASSFDDNVAFETLDVLQPHFVIDVKHKLGSAAEGLIGALPTRSPFGMRSVAHQKFSRGITPAKKKDLESMLPVIPRAKRAFLRGMRTSADVKDLQEVAEEEEEAR